ncbi:hypothetical protein H0H81_005014 [Sphagnurus paluster]|uniref:Uncharacterized protein n=1 Tax=Sphagnurus paluster TaxID=117069 RepID=A0A9P7K722_9AGAR|nr:hypothetical protein H0H81_005014 [Sphagnurus paluster]
MPRIRKKTSNRGTTNNRKRIQQKVRESRKKSKKAAKKNPQWKSKTPKDPGIPNNFPFKDQILAEVSEQRRIDAAEKIRKKEEKKALRAKARNPTEDESENEQGDEDDSMELEPLKGLQIGNDAVGGVAAKQLNAKILSRPAAPVPAQEDDDDDEVPVLVNRDIPNLQAVLDDCDVFIEVLDARYPLSFRSSHLEQLAAAKPGRRILLVLNKIDTCPREAVAGWADYLWSYHPTVLFRSATAFLPTSPEITSNGKGKGKGKAPVDDGLGVESTLACLGEWAKKKKGDKPLAVAIVGIANAGKSSFINSLIRQSALPVYSLETSSRGPTTTELPQEVLIEAAGKPVRLIDTPGLSWQANEEADNVQDVRAHDILLRAKGRIDRLKDPTSVVSTIVARSNAEDLMLLYSLPAFAKGDSTSFLSGIARSNQLVKKHGELDLIGASRILLRDWSTGKFARYTNPPKCTNTSSPIKDAGLKKLYEAQAAVLETLTPRKELRKVVGLVRHSSGECETRKAVLDEPWLKEDREVSDSEDENEDGMEVDHMGDDDDDDDDEEDGDENESDEGSEEGDEEDQEEDQQTPPLSSKQKRKRGNESSTAPPSKKVAFAPDPKSSKQARRAGSNKNKTTEMTSKPVSNISAVKLKGTTSAKPEQKVANVAVKSKTIAKPTSAGGGEAYDFGKFF